jgi:hypothetical protein
MMLQYWLVAMRGWLAMRLFFNAASLAYAGGYGASMLYRSYAAGVAMQLISYALISYSQLLTKCGNQLCSCSLSHCQR